MRVRKVAVRMFAVNRPALVIWTGKLGSEDDVKEEFKEERDPPATHEEGSFLVYSLLHWSLNVFFLFCPILFRSFWRAHLKKKKNLEPACVVHLSFSGTFSPFGTQRWRPSHWSFVSRFQRSGSQYGWPGYWEVWTEEHFCSVPKLQLDLVKDQRPL